jgi:hypothetical protein
MNNPFFKDLGVFKQPKHSSSKNKILCPNGQHGNVSSTNFKKRDKAIDSKQT